MSTSVVINFYDTLANLPISIKTMNKLHLFVSEKFQMSLEDTAELEFSYFGENNEKVLMKNNLDFNRALFFFKNQSDDKKKILFVQVKEESRLFKEFTTNDVPIELVSKNMKLENQETEKIKTEILEKEKLLREIYQKEKEEREKKLEFERLIEKKKIEALEKEMKAKEELAKQKDEMDRKVKEENKMLQERKKKKEEIERKKQAIQAMKKAIEKVKNRGIDKKKEEKIEVDPFIELKDIEKFTEVVIKTAVAASNVDLKEHEIKQLKKKEQKEKEKLMKNYNKIHENYKCDGCGVKPIVGVRYQCTVCDNFDYCETCEEKNGEIHKHPFLKIRDPKYAPIQIKTELKVEEKPCEEKKELGFFDKIKEEVKNIIPSFEKKSNYVSQAETLLSVMDLGGVPFEKLVKALEETKGNVDEALMKLFN